MVLLSSSTLKRATGTAAAAVATAAAIAATAALGPGFFFIVVNKSGGHKCYTQLQM